MSNKDASHAGLLAAAAMGLAAQRTYKTRTPCAFCKRPITNGQGYKFLPKIGHVHGACFQEAKRAEQGEGKDAEQGQPQPAGDRDGVCPEG